MRIDEDGRAVWFGPCDSAQLTAKLCSILDASAGEPEALVWVRRTDIDFAGGTFPLFDDEDGTSHIELHHLDEVTRQRILAFVRAAF